MKGHIQTLWMRISRIGLKPEESVLHYREVIFLNRLLALIPVVMLLYLPLEIWLNGFSMVPVVVLMVLLFMLTLVLHHFRLFRLAHYYTFIMANLVIVHAGLMVGRGINNHVSLIPVVLVGIILFKKTWERILAFGITAGLFIYQHILFDVISPVVEIDPLVRANFSFMFFLMALLLTFLAGFYFLRINREFEGIITEQRNAIEARTKEITDSITYAKRIQNAILPHENLVHELLPDSFLLYIPRDIVAGDFYWIMPSPEDPDTILFAVADCTGHGVPGALVSVVCTNALTKAVKEFGLVLPNQVLDKAREIIHEEFGKNEHEVKDGMDISLCHLNRKNKKLFWSGANNPLVILRNENGSDENRLDEIKADKQPVGSFTRPVPFSLHEIEINKGDQLFLFTDGFIDQFGGLEGKKLKYRRFRELLLECSSLGPEQQKIFLQKHLSDWKGDLEQVDDICVMGVRV